MKCKYVLSDSFNPYYNLALEQNLMEYVLPGEYILFLWQNDNTIVLGRNQNVYAECRVGKFIESGGRITRRRSGGGTVFHDLGNINFSFVSMKNEMEKIDYKKIVKNALKNININVVYNGRNDLTCNGKKFSGNAAYSLGEQGCQHGTIMVNVDIDKMNSFLTPDKGKLERNCVSSVEARVMNLGDVSSKITIDMVKESLIKTTEAVKLKYVPNAEKIGLLKKFYESNEWIYGGIR